MNTTPWQRRIICNQAIECLKRDPDAMMSLRAEYVVDLLEDLRMFPFAEDVLRQTVRVARDLNDSMEKLKEQADGVIAAIVEARSHGSSK
jgi:hypothetical protein